MFSHPVDPSLISNGMVASGSASDRNWAKVQLYISIRVRPSSRIFVCPVHDYHTVADLGDSEPLLKYVPYNIWGNVGCQISKTVQPLETPPAYPQPAGQYPRNFRLRVQNVLRIFPQLMHETTAFGRGEVTKPLPQNFVVRFLKNTTDHSGRGWGSDPCPLASHASANPPFLFRIGHCFRNLTSILVKRVSTDEDVETDGRRPWRAARRWRQTWTAEETWRAWCCRWFEWRRRRTARRAAVYTPGHPHTFHSFQTKVLVHTS